MVIFDTLGLAVPYIPRPPGENDSMKFVFLGGASAGGRGASGVSLSIRVSGDPCFVHVLRNLV